MPQGPRIERVGEEFREILAEEIPKLKDPRIGFVTVTGVKVTADLRRAWVYYTAFGDDKERASTRAGLRSAVPRLRGVIGSSFPGVAFEEDPRWSGGDDRSPDLWLNAGERRRVRWMTRRAAEVLGRRPMSPTAT
jgi:ribosome-binding factor A